MNTETKRVFDLKCEASHSGALDRTDVIYLSKVVGDGTIALQDRAIAAAALICGNCFSHWENAKQVIRQYLRLGTDHTYAADIAVLEALQFFRATEISNDDVAMFIRLKASDSRRLVRWLAESLLP